MLHPMAALSHSTPSTPKKRYRDEEMSPIGAGSAPVPIQSADSGAATAKVMNLVRQLTICPGCNGASIFPIALGCGRFACRHCVTSLHRTERNLMCSCDEGHHSPEQLLNMPRANIVHELVNELYPMEVEKANKRSKVETQFILVGCTASTRCNPSHVDCIQRLQRMTPDAPEVLICTDCERAMFKFLQDNRLCTIEGRDGSLLNRNSTYIMMIEDVPVRINFRPHADTYSAASAKMLSSMQIPMSATPHLYGN
eukprot:TRINITY_DN923_c0_g1_i21.p3 TRINITY_DN923_c0_g1~~TRINITY_DN923_c0_g1_i21.p3  ORF type:complete len:254 (-),score=30.81 TRINITY_DN923_c0_g1_i21:2673-3434(-)